MAVPVRGLLAATLVCVAAFAVVRLKMGPPLSAANLRFDGQLTRDQYEHIIEHAFDVPHGVARTGDVTGLVRQFG